MSPWKAFAIPALAAALMSATSLAPAQISVQIGPQPYCPYGYFDYAPYNCAPYGYYGPDWFDGGTFVGAGPWFHGRRGFYGHVDNRYDPNHGYRGPMPDRGAQPFGHFQGNEARDGQGHIGNPGHDAGGEHNPEAHGAFRGGGGGGFHGGGGEHGGGGHH